MRYLTRKGVLLAMEDVGSGEPAILCLHGNSCNREFFRPQMDKLKTSRRVLALDLRGHGLSDAPRQKYTFAGLADDCLWVCNRLGLKQVVVVAHSMGGAVAAEMIKVHPELVRAVVFLDCTLLPDPAAVHQALPPLIGKLAGSGHLQGLRDFVDPLFAPGDSQELRQWVWEQMSRTPSHVTLSLFEEFLGWRDSATRNIIQPFIYAAGFHWRTDPKTLMRACPQVRTVQIKESGHFMTLAVADKINAMLEWFLERVA